MAAQGKRGIPRAINAIYPVLPHGTPIIVVVDGDREAVETERMITTTTTVPIKLVIIDPEIEIWLMQGTVTPKEEIRRMAHLQQIPVGQYVANQIATMDISKELANEGSFRAFHDALVEAATGQI